MVTEVTHTYRLSDRRRIIEKNKKNPIRHAYFKEYRFLQNLCILILQNTFSCFRNASDQVYGILFDTAWLWEEYLNTIIGKDNTKCAKGFYHLRNKGSRIGNAEGCQYLFDEKEGRIYPDFIGSCNGQGIVADAKYKPEENVGKGNSDYFQILAYMSRFEAKKGYLIFPKEDADHFVQDKYVEEESLLLLKGNSFDKNEEVRTGEEEVRLIKLGLVIPGKCQDHDDFCGKIHRSEEEMQRRIFNEI